MTEIVDSITPEALRPSRVRSPSIPTPPIPPPEFNPPADSPIPPVHSVSPISSSGTASPSSSASSPGGFGIAPDPPLGSSSSAIPRRPDLRAVQRLSDDVILSSPESVVNGSPIASDGGDHLQEMRERLLSESSDSSRLSSDSTNYKPASAPDLRALDPSPTVDTRQPESGPSRPRRASSPSKDKSPEHMWDSVWPASDFPLRPLVVDDMPSFSPAPVSPFITPTFSAPGPHATRRPTSPKMSPSSPTRRATSPVRIRNSVTESLSEKISPPKTSPSKHTRTLSSGSATARPPDRIEPPRSPRNSIGRSKMSESFLRLASPPTVPRSAPTTGRPRRTSFNDAQESRTKPPVPEYDLPTIPPLSSSFALPPPVASPPISLASDDAMVDATEFSPPPVAPIARPAPLRRALSDYATPHAAPPSQLQRTHSITTELASVPDPPVDKTPKQVHQDPPKPSEHPAPIPDGAVQIVDEGDVLPTGDYQMDITFDDEGLNALERVFLLSQSDFGFHRAYVARVVGDLLEDVDPCESVEYVLPLLSGYSMDEDDLVQEAFSSQLHKILWYFFSTCRLVNEPSEIVSITSEGMSSVTKPEQDMPAIPLAIDPSRRASLATSGGASSAGSSLTMPPPSIFDGTEQDTPNSVNSVGTEQTAFSPQPFVDVNGGGDSAKEPLELVPQPELVINTFTPLLGNMLLSANPTVSENTRDAVIAVIGRLRGVVDAEKWVRVKGDQDERKSYISQGGMHAHDLRPFTADAKAMVESELLSGIVIGMGHLSTKPEDGDEPAASPEEIEAYRVLLEQEAEAGRTISMFFIGSLCETYSGSEVVERGFVEEVLRATHGDTNTRTEAAVALSRLAKIVPIDHARRMLPVFEVFVNDEAELVRQAVAAALPQLVKRTESLEERRTFAVEGLSALYNAGQSCRCAAMEVLGELIYAFHDDPLGPPEELVGIYKDDSDEQEVFAGDCDWDIIAAYNFPGVCLTLGSDRWPEIRGLFQRLQERSEEQVLTTIASYLHELAKILTPEQVAEDLLPVYTRLVDSPEGIRERVLEHVDEFMAGLPDELAWMTFLGLDKAWELDTLGQWRTREAVALHLPAFFKLFVKQDRDISPILSITLAALLDKFAAVRDAAIKSIPESYSTLNDTKFDGPFREMILGLATAPEYRRRVTFTRCLREFIKPPPNREAFEEFFIPALPKLRHDVIDVRIALAQIVADLFEVKSYYHDEPNVPVAITQLVRELAEDESRDVRETVRDINLDKIGKGKGPDVEEKSKFHSQPRPTEHSSYLTPRPPVKATDSDATPQPTAAEAELARQPDPFDSSFEHAIHKDNN